MAATAGNNNHADGYFFGHPTNYDAQKPPAVPAPASAKQAVADEKVNAPVQGIPGYYHGRVKPAASDQQSPPDSTHQNSESGFLAKCLMCFSGGRNAR